MTKRADLPPGRDRSIDAARAYAIVGVVAGHWLVTGLVPGPDGLSTASPLTAMPALTPASWLFQTLGLLFFAGGYAAARRRAGGYATTLRRTGGAGVTRRSGADPGEAGPSRPTPARRRGVGRLVWSVLVLLAALGLTLLAGAALGVPSATLHTIARLTASPLWFLLPYLALHLATGPLHHIVHRTGAAAVLPLIAIVAATDAGLVPGPVALLAAWAIPWLLGLVLADQDHTHALISSHRTPTTWAGAALVCWGATALTALVLLADYPSSAVGIPGAGRSNLDPPSLFAVALAVTQIGVFLLLRGPLTALLHNDRVYRPVAVLNRSAVPVYLGHQVALLALAGAAALVNPAMPGLLAAPDSAQWVWNRTAWLPILALLIGALSHGEPDYLRRDLRGTLSDGSRARTTSGGDRCAR